VRSGELLLRRGTDTDGRALLRALVAELAGVAEAGIRIVARCPDCGGDHGRPVVMAPDAATDVRVSLAHAGGVTVAAALVGGAVGIDAEPRPHAADAFPALRRWTRIEAVLKADGRGLRVDPETVEFESTDTLLVGSAPGDPRRYELREAHLGDDLIVSVAIER
jgi:4'-phosphopantetheinyl transferase